MKKRVDYIIIDRLCELAILDFEKMESVVFWLNRYKSVFLHLKSLEGEGGFDNKLGNRFPMQMQSFNNIYHTFLILINKANYSHPIVKGKSTLINTFQPDFFLN
jgi:hypothetical protein